MIASISSPDCLMISAAAGCPTMVDMATEFMREMMAWPMLVG